MFRGNFNQYSNQIDYLTNIKLYQCAVLSLLHLFEEQQRSSALPQTSYLYEALQQANELFDAVIGSLDQPVPETFPLTETQEILEKEESLSSSKPFLRQSVENLIAAKIATNETKIKKIVTTVPINSIAIQSDRLGLRTYSFFNTLNTQLRAALNSPSVDTTLATSSLNDLELSLSTQSRVFTESEIVKILQILLPLCTETSKLHIINSGISLPVFAFAQILEGRALNPTTTENNENDPSPLLQEYLQMYRADAEAQSFIDATPSAEERAAEAARLARKAKIDSRDSTSVDDDNHRQAATPCNSPQRRW